MRFFYYETGVCGSIMCPKRLEEHRRGFILESLYSNPNWNKVRRLFVSLVPSDVACTCIYRICVRNNLSPEFPNW